MVNDPVVPMFSWCIFVEDQPDMGINFTLTCNMGGSVVYISPPPADNIKCPWGIDHPATQMETLYLSGQTTAGYFMKQRYR